MLDPFGQDFPESVVGTLEDSALCARFDPTGHLIAAGRVDGWTTIWDVDTKGALRYLEGHVKPVTSVRLVRLHLILILMHVNLAYLFFRRGQLVEELAISLDYVEGLELYRLGLK
jgi:hypothetical protein